MMQQHMDTMYVCASNVINVWCLNSDSKPIRVVDQLYESQHVCLLATENV